jgi:hypothetical protein
MGHLDPVVTSGSAEGYRKPPGAGRRPSGSLLPDMKEPDSRAVPRFQGGIAEGPLMTATSNPQDLRPAVYGSPVAGYMRSPLLGDPQLCVLEAGIRQYARKHGYNLVAVFREEGVSSVAAWRPELEKLIRGLERRVWVGVLVPSETHWSSRPAIARRISRRIVIANSWWEDTLGKA